MAEPSIYDILELTHVEHPNTPEENFYQYMTTGNASSVDNMIHYLKHEIEHFKHLKEYGVRLTKSHSLTENKDLSLQEYVGLMINYYMQMHHYTRFAYSDLTGDDGAKMPRLDLTKTVKMFLDDARVQELIRQSQN